MEEEILRALNDWNIWWETKAVPDELKGRIRLIRQDLISTLEFKEVKVITGVRRSGKSTLLYQMIDNLLSHVHPEQILMINFEDEALEKYSLDAIYAAYVSARPSKDVYLFLDEVNRKEGWEKWVRKRYDLRELKHIFVTGSSSFLLKGEYSSLLTGRNIKLDVFPLSFREFLDFSGLGVQDPHSLSSLKVSKVKGILRRYVESGGFPEAFSKKGLDRRKLLTNYYEDIIFRDVADRHNIVAKRVRELANFLITNIANVVSYRSIRNSLGMGLETISNYLTWLEESYLIFQLPFFSYSLKEQQVRPGKVYCIDTGLRNAICLRFSEDIGRLVENLVFIELRRRGKEVYYWRDKKQREIDFVVREGLKPKELLQVCYDIEDKETHEREVKALVNGLKTFGLREGVVITGDYHGEDEIDGRLIRYKPLWMWLLEQ